MRDLKVVGLDGRHIICETDTGGDSPDKFRLPVNDKLRAAVRGEQATAGQTEIDLETITRLKPRDIQARIRAGASVEQLAESCGGDQDRIRRFAEPVLLERARAAELATAAHPVLADGPSVLTLLETITGTLIGRGLNPENLDWDAWRNEDGRWTVQLTWRAGRSENVAHFRFTPGPHGGTVVAIDDGGNELVEPDFERPLRPVAAIAQLDFTAPEQTARRGAAPTSAISRPAPAAAPPTAAPAPAAETPRPQPAADAPVAEEKPAPKPRSRGRAHPAVPGWEDVLLGVRSGSDR